MERVFASTLMATSKTEIKEDTIEALGTLIPAKIPLVGGTMVPVLLNQTTNSVYPVKG